MKLPFDSAGLALEFRPAEIAVEKFDGTQQTIPVTPELLDAASCCLYIREDGPFALVAGSKLCPWCLARFRAVSELRFSKELFCPVTCKACEFEQRDKNWAYGYVRDPKRFSLVQWQRLQALRNVSSLVFSNKTGYRITIMGGEDKIVEPHQQRILVFPPGRRKLYGGVRGGVESWRSADGPFDFASKRYRFVIEKKNGSIANLFKSFGELDVTVRFEGTEEYGEETEETRKAHPELYTSGNDVLEISAIIDSFVPPAELQLKKIIIGEVHVGDKYVNKGNVGAMGPNSSGTFNQGQVLTQVQKIVEQEDFKAEIGQLLVALRQRAQSPDQHDAVRAVAEAETDLRTENGSAAMSKLARAGLWTLGIAKEIGTKLAVEALEKSAGLK